MLHLLIILAILTIAIFFTVLLQHIAEAKRQNRERNILYRGHRVSVEEVLRQILLEESC